MLFTYVYDNYFAKVAQDSFYSAFFMRVAFFTPRSTQPLHPRLMSFEAFFQSRGIAVDFINKSHYTNTIMSRINWLSLWFFDYYATSLCKPLVKNYDIIFVTDLKYLPLAKYAKKLNKIVFYDTIDHNVDLRFYQLQHKFNFIRPFRKIIVNFFRKIELQYTSRYCDEILVNSNSLQKYFNNGAHTLFYSSPFESFTEKNSSSNPAALLYLGIFSPEKGGFEILELQKKLNLPLFIFGDISTNSLAREVEKSEQIHYTPKISVAALQKELLKLLDNYYLIGFSLIKPAHFSYEVQEANKDIDYLALGIPLIGNYRLPTKEKINAGCGIFFDDSVISEKINDLTRRQTLTLICQAYYVQYYSSKIFNATMEKLAKQYNIH
jgi:hypothetical protein